MTMLRDSCELSLKRQAPGQLAGWVRSVILGAAIVTFVAVTLGAALVWDQLPSWIELGAFRHGLTFFVSFWLLATYLPQWTLARSLRVAVLLPIAHAIVIGCAWPVWCRLAPYALDADATTALAKEMPIVLATVGGAVGLAGFAALVARRRSGEWVHGFAMVALAELLLLGLWIPIACAAWPGGRAEYWSATHPLLAHAGAQMLFTLVPPTLAALAFTTVALRRPGTLHAARPTIVLSISLLLVIAILTRMMANSRMLLLYSNFLPVLLVATLVAICGLVALGAVTWARSARIFRAFSALDSHGGTVVDDGEPVAIGLEITSWLRGPRVVQRTFSVRTSVGTLPIRGAHLVAAIPPATTQLAMGESIAIVRAGDDVQVAGASDAGGDPFRTSAAPLADAMYVAPAALEPGGFASAALVMWRPCVAYLLIVCAIALPALAGLTAT
jgi:hypothetical protein